MERIIVANHRSPALPLPLPLPLPPPPLSSLIKLAPNLTAGRPKRDHEATTSPSWSGFWGLRLQRRGRRQTRKRISSLRKITIKFSLFQSAVSILCRIGAGPFCEEGKFICYTTQLRKSSKEESRAPPAALRNYGEGVGRKSEIAADPTRLIENCAAVAVADAAVAVGRSGSVIGISDRATEVFSSLIVRRRAP